jgi:hypothetical protein
MTTEPTTPAAAGRRPGDPILVLLTSHWASILGVCLIGTALISWLFVLPLQMRGRATNPYIDRDVRQRQRCETETEM